MRIDGPWLSAVITPFLPCLAGVVRKFERSVFLIVSQSIRAEHLEWVKENCRPPTCPEPVTVPFASTPLNMPAPTKPEDNQETNLSDSQKWKINITHPLSRLAIHVDCLRSS